MAAGYVELHARSFYSFGMGASHVHELLARAVGYGYPALALTDVNLCGALEFARLANSMGIKPITGGELTLKDGSRLVLLAKTRQGYSNISSLFTLANAADRREPRLDPVHLPEHSGDVILLTYRAQWRKRPHDVGKARSGHRSDRGNRRRDQRSLRGRRRDSHRDGPQRGQARRTR